MQTYGSKAKRWEKQVKKDQTYFCWYLQIKNKNQNGSNKEKRETFKVIKNKVYIYELFFSLVLFGTITLVSHQFSNFLFLWPFIIYCYDLYIACLYIILGSYLLNLMPFCYSYCLKYLVQNFLQKLIITYILIINQNIKPMDSDFQIFKRTSDESGKYAWAKFNQPEVDMDKAIIVSHADMQFKFSPSIYKKLLEKIGENPHFGYPQPKKSFWKALSDWVTNRYCRQAIVTQKTTVIWNNTITAIHGVTENVTKPGDEILIICPVYYFFLILSKYKDRKMVEFVLDSKDNNFYIDFDKLEDVIKANKIKLLIFCSPWNPCGRIWTREQLRKLSDLSLKYKFYLLSDQIYSDCVEPSQQQQQQGLTVKDVFTSMLYFQEQNKYLIYLNSYTKAFNSSGMALSYSISYDPDLHNKLNYYKIYSGGGNNAMSYELLEVIYTSAEARDWKKRCIDYIKQNYNTFKKQCKQKLPKLQIYEMQCSYLCLIDFKQYGLAGSQLKKKFSKVHVCPTFMQQSFVKNQERSLIRLNLAANRQVIVELVDRMRQMIQIEQ